MTNTVLDVRNLEHTYGSGDTAFRALGDISLTVAPGEFVCIVGPSGCGKTTLLRSLAGLQQPTGGTVTLKGQRVTGPPAGMAVVFQDYSRSLLPWMTVAHNVELPLRAMKVPKRERRERVDSVLADVGLADAAGKHPWQLSGGMQQRVAIARAIACQPEILIMDEPFASVDAQTRTTLEDLVLRIRHLYGLSVLFVTHDIDEAVYLGDTIMVLGTTPTTVMETISVDLPRPRDQVETKLLPEFAAHRSHVFSLIRKASDSD